ncbi:nucleic acid-binding protein [Microstroma glucosiphilum]|uniref:Nucleic acid-binding protein n=1 Tax=Pseudomicrostroma glucosiphilum TaxID=1684307 RepID=A0A316UG99_9BASI|nr:nucleic acid-binding protein [Pseudomicrostroma glucosiphilum]PWN24286.1 nucleic acid-binding protein [Pseudomicrostroma glucosiphilum]
MFTIARSAAAAAPRRALLSRPFSSTPSAADYARMQLLGRLIADPETRATRSGKDYVRYTLATNDPVGPPGEDGERPPETTSFHNIFAFGDAAVQRLQKLQKGTLVVVDAEFRVQRNPSEDGGPAGSSYLVQHKSCHVVSRPKTE